MLYQSRNVAAALDSLIESGPLDVAFQPIVDMERGRPLGYEVLGRCGPVEGPLASVVSGGPAALLDLAFTHGRLLALDRRWRQLAVERIARADVDDDVSWFINVDPRAVDQAGFQPGFTEALVRDHSLAPHRFVLELTEVVSRDPCALQRVLDHYTRQGFRVALDDLGAEQQSFATLLRVQPSIIKLDGVLLRGIEHDPARRHLLASLCEFGRRCDALVIAECVETESELEAALAAGVRVVQGFFLGRPAAMPTPPGPMHPQKRAVRPALRRAPDELLARLSTNLRVASGLEPMLQQVCDVACELVGGDRASLRLLDESRTRLLVAARAGAPVHGTGELEFRVGEGLAGWIVQSGEHVLVDDAERDPRFVPKPGQSAPLGAFVGVPLLDTVGAIGVLAVSALDGAFTPAHVRWLQVVAGLATPHLDIARLNRIAITDDLTLALNRRALDILIPQQPVANEDGLCVVLIDIDHFKGINDRLGHAAGDDVLRAVPRVLRSMLRRGDEVVRLGGDEFLMVLRGVAVHVAQQIAERACLAVAGASIVGEPITLSAGVAERGRDESRDMLLGRADRALYRAKERGRNQAAIDDLAV